MIVFNEILNLDSNIINLFLLMWILLKNKVNLKQNKMSLLVVG